MNPSPLLENKHQSHLSKKNLKMYKQKSSRKSIRLFSETCLYNESLDTTASSHHNPKKMKVHENYSQHEILISNLRKNIKEIRKNEPTSSEIEEEKVLNSPFEKHLSKSPVIGELFFTTPLLLKSVKNESLNKLSCVLDLEDSSSKGELAEIVGRMKSPSDSFKFSILEMESKRSPNIFSSFMDSISPILGRKSSINSNFQKYLFPHSRRSSCSPKKKSLPKLQRKSSVPEIPKMFSRGIQYSPLMGSQDSVNLRLEEAEKMNLTMQLQLNNYILEKTVAEEKIFNLQEELKQGEEIRICMHNKLQQRSGNLRIFCRVKSISDSETAISFPTNNSIKSEMLTLTLDNQKKKYVFDKIFPQNSSQSEFFDEISPLFQSAFDGQNICIFAYGQTGSGKTYTLEGPPNYKLFYEDSPSELSGVLPRAGAFIMRENDRLNKAGCTVKVSLSAIEIYNDQVNDLFNPNKDGQNLALLTTRDNKTQIKNQTWKPIQTIAQLMELITQASKRRKTDKTIHNQRSSRSHSIYQFSITVEDSSSVRKGLLNITDLAGAEESDTQSLKDKNQKEKNHMKKIQNEANSINKSLTTLRRIMEMLSQKSRGLKIPYRDSKLTRILQECLSDTSITVMIVNICPSIKNSKQTFRSLNYASIL